MIRHPMGPSPVSAGDLVRLEKGDHCLVPQNLQRMRFAGPSLNDSNGLGNSVGFFDFQRSLQMATNHRVGVVAALDARANLTG